MITNLQKTKTRLGIINNIPKKFFSRIEESDVFDDGLFPVWVNEVYAGTQLKRKFEPVYNKYKALNSATTRKGIVDAFSHTQCVESLCNNEKGTKVITIDVLPKSLRKEIDDLFEYLYKTALNYHGFEGFVKDTTKDLINRFKNYNRISICPFCGLEGYINLDGQARLSLDHWLNRDFFPMAAVNMNNLIPIGASCNNRPVKGNENILFRGKTRIRALYPFSEHSGISLKFDCA